MNSAAEVNQEGGGKIGGKMCKVVFISVSPLYVGLGLDRRRAACLCG